MSSGLYPLLCDVTAYTENTATSTVAFWTVFTELLPGNALIKFVTVLLLLVVVVVVVVVVIAAAAVTCIVL
jgi:hypothetical protein